MKKVILIILALVLLCCLCSIGFVFLFGNFSANDKCSYKGPLANVTEGPCATASTNTTTQTNNPTPTPTPSTDTTPSNMKSYQTSDFSFNYPKEWLVQEKNGLIYVYSQDPETTPAGQFINNIVITKEDITGSPVASYSCEDYANKYILPATKQTYESTLKNFAEKTLNGKRTCEVSLDGKNSKGQNIGQLHYGVFSNNTLYYFTISIDQSTQDVQGFVDAANSFKVK